MSLLNVDEVASIPLLRLSCPRASHCRRKVLSVSRCTTAASHVRLPPPRRPFPRSIRGEIRIGCPVRPNTQNRASLLRALDRVSGESPASWIPRRLPALRDLRCARTSTAGRPWPIATNCCNPRCSSKPQDIHLEPEPVFAAHRFPRRRFARNLTPLPTNFAVTLSADVQGLGGWTREKTRSTQKTPGKERRFQTPFNGRTGSGARHPLRHAADEHGERVTPAPARASFFFNRRAHSPNAFGICPAPSANSNSLSISGCTA